MVKWIEEKKNVTLKYVMLVVVIYSVYWWDIKAFPKFV